MADMQWLLWMIAVAVLGLAAVGASGRLGELPGTVTDTPRPHVPTGVLSGDDLRGLRFAVVPRGYSMDQVDELLDRMARQLDAARRPVAVGVDPAGFAAGADGGHDVPATGGSDEDSSKAVEPSGIMDGVSSQPERG